MKTVVQGMSQKEVTTKFGKKPTYSFKGADGEWYSLGFKKPAFGAGEEVEFEFESTKFGNQVTAVLSSHTGGGSASITPSAKPSAGFPRGAPAASYGNKGVFPVPVTDGQRSIIRQSSTTNAVKIVEMFHVNRNEAYKTIDGLVDEVIRVAKRLEAHSAGDTDAVKAMKEEKEAAKLDKTD